MSRALQTGADARALRDTKFPEIFKQKVDITKVQLPVIKKWMADKITKLQGFDDDFLPIMIEEMLIEHRDIREIQTSIRDSLGPPTAAFCLELWKLCLSAQQDPNGVPKELLEAKKLEVKQQKLEEEKQREAARVRQEAERNRERELEHIRTRERAERREQSDRIVRDGRARDGTQINRRGTEHRSPPPHQRSQPRRDDDDFYRAPRRTTDSYIPSSRGRGRKRPRSRSSTRSLSRSRTRSPRRTRRSLSTSRTPPRRRTRRRRSPSHSPSRSPVRRRSRSSDRRSSPPRRRDDRRRSSSPPYSAKSERVPKAVEKYSLSPPTDDDLMARRHAARKDPRLSRSVSSDSRSPPRRRNRPSDRDPLRRHAQRESHGS